MTNKLTHAILELVLHPFSQIERLFVLVADTCSFSNLFECCFFLLAWILLVISFLSILVQVSFDGCYICILEEILTKLCDNFL